MILAHRKNSKRRSAQFSEQFVLSMGREFDAVAAENSSRRDALLGCLRKLSEFHRSLLLDCYAPEASIKQVASQLNRSVRGLQQTVARLRVVLQRCIEQNMRRMGED
jgi:RNA polymerase sigma-70 factor (ECF subfamily)